MKKILGVSLICFMMSVIGSAVADDTNTQTNTSGSNTNITGGYTTTNNNTYQSGSSNDTTNTTTNNSTTTNTTNGHDTRVAGMASAPSMSAYSQDLCLVGISGGISTIGFGVSAGTYKTDENCERIKLSKVLSDLGMKVASVSILCQDPRVFFAMEQSGTPCPFEGKIGKEALAQWNKYDIERPDYETYITKLESRSQIDKELEEIARQEEAKRLAEEKARKEAELETLKAQEELDNIIIETDLETKEQRIINIHN